MNVSRRLLLAATAAFAVVGTRFASAGDEREFDQKAFDEAQAAGKSILVHVTAPWCGTCKRQKPIVAELAEKPDFLGMTIFNVDFDTQKDVLREFKVQVQSTMIAFKGHEETFRSVGETDPAAIESILRKAL